MLLKDHTTIADYLLVEHLFIGSLAQVTSHECKLLSFTSMNSYFIASICRFSVTILNNSSGVSNMHKNQLFISNERHLQPNSDHVRRFTSSSCNIYNISLNYYYFFLGFAKCLCGFYWICLFFSCSTRFFNLLLIACWFAEALSHRSIYEFFLPTLKAHKKLLSCEELKDWWHSIFLKKATWTWKLMHVAILWRSSSESYTTPEMLKCIVL